MRLNFVVCWKILILDFSIIAKELFEIFLKLFSNLLNRLCGHFSDRRCLKPTNWLHRELSLPEGQQSSTGLPPCWLRAPYGGRTLIVSTPGGEEKVGMKDKSFTNPKFLLRPARLVSRLVFPMLHSFSRLALSR